MSWVYLLRERRSITPAPQQFPRGRPFEELGSTLGGQSIMGGRSESYARSYASGPGSRDGTLQVSRAGNAGKSLTTPISIQPWRRRHQGDFGGIDAPRSNHLLMESPNDAGMVPEWSNSAFPPTRTFRQYLRVHFYPRQARQLRRRAPKDTQSGQALPRTRPAEGQICGRPHTKPVKEAALRRAWGRQLGQLERHFLASERHLRQEPFCSKHALLGPGHGARGRQLDDQPSLHLL